MSGSRSLSSFVLSALLAFAVAACSTDTSPSGETGGLSLELVLADGVIINEVDWRIFGNGMDMSDTINTGAPGSTASVEVFGLPKGDENYTIILSATSVGGDVTCGGSEEFNVEAGETTNVMVILHCKLPQRLGAVRVNGKFNICAELAKAVVSPLQTSVGNDIDLSAIGVDRDNDPITYSWTSTGGTIADPSAAVTTYTCVDVGDHNVAISVTDNDEVCDMANWTIPVTCVEGDGGTGGTGGMGTGGAGGEVGTGGMGGMGGEVGTGGMGGMGGEVGTGGMGGMGGMGGEVGTGGMGGTGGTPDCTMNIQCDDQNDCTINTCDAGVCVSQDATLGDDCLNGSDPGVCDGAGSCVACNADTDCGDFVCVDNACVECRDVSQCPGGGECRVPACEGNSCALNDAANGTSCLDGGGECMNGTCEVTSIPVIGEGSGSTDWQAVPTTATGCTYDTVNTICTDCTITGPSVPGGGQCGQFGAQIVRGCEVPGGVLNAQLAIDVTVSLDVVSDGAGNLGHAITIRAENPALSTAAGLVSVDGAEIFSSVTTGVPAQLSNVLNPALAGDILGLFTGGTNVLLLDDDPASVPSNTNNGVEILPDSTAVTPTSSPTVDVNFSGDFLLQLTIQSSGTPLDVDAASCTFDTVGAPITLPVL